MANGYYYHCHQRTRCMHVYIGCN